MTFEEIITVLTPFFEKNKFIIAERFKDSIKYESKNTAVIVGYDFRDNSISIYVGKKGGDLDELSGDVLSKFFDDNIRLCNDRLFTENLIRFLNGKGNAILKGDLKVLDELDNFTNRMAKEYTDNLIRSQIMKAADEAWTEKKYSEFIKHLDKLEKDLLSQTYLMKYQYALKKKAQ